MINFSYSYECFLMIKLGFILHNITKNNKQFNKNNFELTNAQVYKKLKMYFLCNNKKKFTRFD